MVGSRRSHCRSLRLACNTVPSSSAARASLAVVEPVVVGGIARRVHVEGVLPAILLPGSRYTANSARCPTGSSGQRERGIQCVASSRTVSISAHVSGQSLLGFPTVFSSE